jgi:hypothetical protein
LFLDTDTSSSSEDEVEDEGIIHTEYLGTDPDGPSDSDSSEQSADEDENKDENEEEPAARVFVVSSQEEVEPEFAQQLQQEQKKMKMKEKKKQERRQQQDGNQDKEYNVGDFVTAVYEGQWLIAQVDINQDMAGESHVNLSYMQRIGENQFKWPKGHDLLLTLKEDILTRCTAPVLVGSTLRATYVGLKPNEALEADAALAAMVYLQLFLDQNFWQFFLTFHLATYFQHMLLFVNVK